MTEINPQVTPTQVENTQGISIDDIVGTGGVPLSNLPTLDVIANPEGFVPPATQDKSNLNTTPTPTPVSTSTQDVDPATPPANTPPADEAPQQDELTQLLLSADPNNAEDTAIRTNIFTKFGATSADASGNLLDASGRIVLSRSNLDNYIDTGNLLLDANGNHVNEQGEILTPATEVQANNTFVQATQTAIEEEFGFTFKDSEGNPKAYANSIDGMKEFVVDAVNNANVNAVAQFLNGNDELKQIYFHLANGGTIDNFVNETFDYTSVDVATLTREQKLNYIKTAFDKQGLKNMGSTIKLLEGASDEALVESTSDALLTLAKLTEETKTQAEQTYLANKQRQEEEAASYWSGLKSIIDTGKVGEISIPNDEKDKFYNYIAVVKDSSGRSQEQIDMDNEDPNFGLMVSYLRYKNLKLDDLIKIRARSNRVHSAKERFGISTPVPTPSPAPRTNAPSSTVISLNDFVN